MTMTCDQAQARTATHPRWQEARELLGYIHRLEPCSVVGISNIGKSFFMRLLCDPEVQRAHLGSEAEQLALVYIDCNRMLEMSDQGFYELVLRCILDQLREPIQARDLTREVRTAYEAVVSPPSPFHVPLSFNQAITALINQLQRRLVLLFDEFDAPLARIEGRVFLNLRALRDQYPGCLTYVTATNRRLGEIRGGEDVGEFNELFAHHRFYLGPLSELDARQFIAAFIRREPVTFDEADIRFILEWAGGHPGLLEAVCWELGSVTGEPVRDALQDRIIHRQVEERLGSSLNVRSECTKIWRQLTDEEQAALLALFDPGQQPNPVGLTSLWQKRVLVANGDDPQLFSRAFTEYVQRQHLVQRPEARGIVVDVDSGEVYVDGKPVPALTNLEYRLLLLLYGRMGKICDKYTVVESVWGEAYINEVDDARIEKLVSRLRQKIEPDPSHPRYLITVRGRGYKLVGG
ncbi:MAG TPA: winged helix-turn-helix transcriptional regulator [Caldilineae bacterium]|nr:winged helix-turn-helix transcriptional regulator [Caldilineae bacterium]